MRILAVLLALAAWLCAGPGRAQEVPASPAPAQPAAGPAGLTPKEILDRTLKVYAGAKTYQSTWTYDLKQGDTANRVTVEIKSRPPVRLYFHVAPAPGQKRPEGEELIPELLVVLDGKTAYFHNASANVHYKVPLGQSVLTSPLMFLPQVPTVAAVERGPDITADGKTYYVLRARKADGASTRMEIDAATFRIHRIVQEEAVGALARVSTLLATREVFDADLPESVFVFRAPRGSKEIPAPLDAAAIFGPPAKE